MGEEAEMHFGVETQCQRKGPERRAPRALSYFYT